LVAGKLYANGANCHVTTAILFLVRIAYKIAQPKLDPAEEPVIAVFAAIVAANAITAENTFVKPQTAA
jgi:hypothetical protein